MDGSLPGHTGGFDPPRTRKQNGVQASAARCDLNESRQLRFPTRPESVRAARAAVRNFGAEQGIRREQLDDIMLAVTEAMANSVRHAHSGYNHGLIEVTVTVAGSDLVVRTHDDGEWGGDAGDRRGLGLGLSLMHTLADACLISSGSTGTLVELRFRIQRA
jgi:serine/threonine-protein kinase RsbW